MQVRAVQVRFIVSPADGRVLYVREVSAGVLPNPVKAGVEVPLDDWLGTTPADQGGTLIGIYMTPLSVHYSIAAVVPRPAVGENLSMVRAFMRLTWNMPRSSRTAGTFWVTPATPSSSREHFRWS
jgi:hypothetical protein